ncbi:MAG: hypothetical protein AB1816_02410 [Bacillota bacterium]
MVELRQPGMAVWPGEQSAYLVAAAAMAAYHVGLPASGRLVVAGGGEAGVLDVRHGRRCGGRDGHHVGLGGRGGDVGVMWVFWGSDFLPRDLWPSPEHVRRWAVQEGLLWDPETQLLTDERVEVARELFGKCGDLGMVMCLEPDDSGRPSYLEYIYVPVATLIKFARPVDLVIDDTDGLECRRENREIRRGAFWFLARRFR